MQDREHIMQRSNLDLDFKETDAFVRSKTSLRMHYEAQVAVIEKQAGSLEKIRENLGLSSRKISQLLMIDPSSWTRWTRHGDQVPPHIWRALQWYLILREKIPGLTPAYFLGQDPKVLHERALQKISEEKTERLQGQAQMKEELLVLRKKMRRYQGGLIFFILLSILLTGLLFKQF